MKCSLYYVDILITTFFPRISDHLPKILQNLSEGHKNVAEHFPKMFEDKRRSPKTFEDDPKMFRSYTNAFQYILIHKLDIIEIIDIFTSEDIKITSCARAVFSHEFLMYQKRNE